MTSTKVLVYSTLSLAALLSVAGIVWSQKTTPNKQTNTTTTKRNNLRSDQEAVEIISALDTFAQNRFRSEMNTFGLSRMIPEGIAGLTHNTGVALQPNKEEKELLKHAASFNREYDVFFLHIKPVPEDQNPKSRNTKFRTIHLNYSYEKKHSTQPFVVHLNPLSKYSLYRSPAYDRSKITKEGFANILKKAKEDYKVALKEWEEKKKRREQKVLAAIKDELPKLSKTPMLVTSFEGKRVEIRSVLADQKCLSCHTNAKAGETLGAMVYMVSPNKSFAKKK